MDLSQATEPLFGLLMGLALSSICGLRAFLPLAAVSALAWSGRLELTPDFLWLGHPVALLCFASAVLIETIGDKLPAVDHLLDGLGVLVKPVAATVVSAGFIQDVDPLLALVAALCSGGLVAEGVHLAKAKVRLLSSALTGTLGNPVLSVLEDVVALLGLVLALVVPVLVLGVAALLGVKVWRRWRGRSAGAVR